LEIVSRGQSDQQHEIERERYALALVGAGLGVWDWEDVTKDAQVWCPRFYKLLGYVDGEIDGSLENFRAHLHEDDQEMHFINLEKHFEERTPFDLEYRLKNKSGQYRWFRGTGQAVFDENGRPLRMVGALQDIHQRKVLEEDVNASKKDLDEFVYLVSHDLREPLRGMRNFSGFLVEDYGAVLDDTGKKYLQTIQKLGLRLENYLDSLLQYSRLGREKMDCKPVDLNSLIANAVSELKQRHSDLGLSVEVQKDLPTISCDSSKLTKILSHLLENAILYNTAKDKEVRIRYSQIDGDSYQLSIEDNGIGILEKHHKTIFSLFKRLHGREEFGGGTGMGLTLVKKAVESLGGSIWLESEADKGATFHFTFKSTGKVPG